MALHLSVLASGSKANAILLSDGSTRILVDSGLGIRNMTAALLAANTRLDQLTAILLTHEHTDHVRGLAKLLERTKVGLFASRGTLDCVDWMVPNRVRKTVMNGETVEIGGFAVRAFAIPHDAAEPLAYHVETGLHRVIFATDLGEVPVPLARALSQATCAVFESNHDLDMLLNGSYPPILKQRIRSSRGHLSNDQSAAALAASAGHGLRTVVLAHISDNNDPALARAAAERALEDSGAQLYLTARGGTGPFLNLDDQTRLDPDGTLPGLL